MIVKEISWLNFTGLGGVKAATFYRYDLHNNIYAYVCRWKKVTSQHLGTVIKFPPINSTLDLIN